MNLYEVNQEVAQLGDMFAEAEISQQVYKDTLESLGGDIAAEDVIREVRNRLADAEKFKAESKRLAEKSDAALRSADRLKRLLVDYMRLTDKKSAVYGLFKVVKKTSKSVLVDQESWIPEKYLLPQPPKIDRKAILAALKAGEYVDGARLTEKDYIVIT